MVVLILRMVVRCTELTNFLALRTVLCFHVNMFLQYLEMRFNYAVRVIGVVMFMVSQVGFSVMVIQGCRGKAELYTLESCNSRDITVRNH